MYKMCLKLNAFTVSIETHYLKIVEVMEIIYDVMFHYFGTKQLKVIKCQINNFNFISLINYKSAKTLS